MKKMNALEAIAIMNRMIDETRYLKIKTQVIEINRSKVREAIDK